MNIDFAEQHRYAIALVKALGLDPDRVPAQDGIALHGLDGGVTIRTVGTRRVAQDDLRHQLANVQAERDGLASKIATRDADRDPHTAIADRIGQTLDAYGGHTPTGSCATARDGERRPPPPWSRRSCATSAPSSANCANPARPLYSRWSPPPTTPKRQPAPK